MIRVVLITSGSLLSLLGLVLMVTPVPGSSIALASGIAMLVCSSNFAARCLQILRTRVRPVNAAINWLENRAGATIGGALRRSRPDQEPRENVDQ